MKEKDSNQAQYGAVPQEESSAAIADCPYEKASFPSKVIYWWMNGLLKKGLKKPIVIGDLPGIPSPDNIDLLIQRMEHYIQLNPKSSLFITTMKVYKKELLLSGLFKILSDVLVFTGTLVLQRIILFLETPNAPIWEGIVYASVLLVCSLFQCWFSHGCLFLTNRLCMNIRSSLIALVYKKSLKLPHTGKQKSTGEIVNLQSIDSSKASEFATNIHVVWAAPIQLIIALVLLWTVMGATGLVGLGVILLTTPMQVKLFSIISEIQKTLLEQKDKRTKVLNEVLQGIRVIKFFAWENSYKKLINDIRNQELASLVQFWLYCALALFLFD
eukprot:TRINITY_DN1068_c0_g1_i1.p1 TRINITY_DN1068_c0_g1~~TRINITY_DN1068_c0_g1_i1.p1  ORF type:complete len:328 (+),score=71.96 TRINITY_DN1068_c0_g1_i1:386-1369(+)